MPRNDPQINVRQSPERYAVLEAAAFVHGKGTPGKLVEELVNQAVDRYATLAPVQKALEARAEQAAEEAGKLARLPRERAGRRPNTA